MRLLVLLLALACRPDDAGKGQDPARDSADDGEPFLAPDAEGPYTASTFEDAFTPSHGTALAVQVWYPSAEPAGTLHLYDNLVEGTASDALPAACESPRPVVVFSHGNGGMRWQSIWLTETLATRGWVVVAPDHTYNTVFDMDDDHFAELVFRRPVDAKESFDWLARTAGGPGGPLEGCIDESAGYAMIGHSFGGYTTYAITGAPIDKAASAAYCEGVNGWLCDEVALYFEQHPEETGVDLSDARAWAGVPMTPAGYEALLGGLAEITVPMLTWGGGRDTLTPVASIVRPFHEGLQTTPRYFGIIEEAGHYSFSDACKLLDSFPDCDPPFRPPEEVQAVARVSTIAFLDLVRGYEEAATWLPVEDAGLSWEEVE